MLLVMQRILQVNRDSAVAQQQTRLDYHLQAQAQSGSRFLPTMIPHLCCVNCTSRHFECRGALLTWNSSVLYGTTFSSWLLVQRVPLQERAWVVLVLYLCHLLSTGLLICFDLLALCSFLTQFSFSRQDTVSLALGGVSVASPTGDAARVSVPASSSAFGAAKFAADAAAAAAAEAAAKQTKGPGSFYA
jgi:hypothetical protein